MDTPTWKILLVDDDEDDYFLTRHMLSKSKYRNYILDWASSYEDGWAKIQAGGYDAMLMDYDLGLHNGLELTRLAVDNGCPFPIILYTGRGSYEVDLQAMQAGAALYLTKNEVNPLLLERGIRYAIERKQSEQALANANKALSEANELLSRQKQEIDQRLQERSHILESIQDSFFSIDRNWTIIFMNSKAARYAGIEPEQAIGKNFWETFPKAKGTWVEQQYRRAMQERLPMQFEAQGVYAQSIFSIQIYPSEEGISILSQDITERKMAERALETSRQEQARLASFPEKNPNPILEIDLTGKIIYINPQANKLFPDLKNKGVGHAYLAAWEEILASFLKEPAVNQIHQVQVKDRYYQQSVFYYQQYKLIRIYGMDITIRKQAELALEIARAKAIEDKNRLQAVMQVLPVGVVISDVQGGSFETNPAFEQVWGGRTRPAQTVADYTAYQAWWADTGEPVAPAEWALAQSVMKGEAVQGQVMQIQRFDGNRAYVLNSAAPVKDSAGRVIGSAVAIQDITPLKQSEILNQALFEIQQILHATHDPDQVMQEAVSVACKALGCDTGVISLLKDHHWQVGYVVGFPQEIVGTRMSDDEERHAILAVQSRKPVAVNDAFNDERVNQEHLRKWGVRSVLTIPILLQGEAIGVLFFNYHSQLIEFQPYHIQFGLNLAASISLALENARLFVRLREEIEQHKRVEKALQNQEATLLGILNATKESVWLFGTDGTILMANVTALSRLNRTAEEVIGAHFDQILPAKLAQARQARLKETIESKQPVAFEDQRAGIFFHHSFYPVMDANGQVTSVASFSRDITDRKRAQSDLEQYAQQLEQSNRNLQDYANIASHDMQEPLRKIISFAGHLQDRAGSKLDAEEGDYLERICATAERMASMLRVLLEYSSFPATNEPYTSVDLAEVTTEVLQALEFQIERSGGQVEVGELPVIEAEPTQMYRLFQNLIGNALKFSRPGCLPQVRISSGFVNQPLPSEPQMVEIRVEDNGIGFDPKSIDRLFLPFHRLVGRSEYEGSGMGLAICRKIVERHSGTIVVEAQPGQGATFIVRLPVKQAEQ